MLIYKAEVTHPYDNQLAKADCLAELIPVVSMLLQHLPDMLLLTCCFMQHTTNRHAASALTVTLISKNWTSVIHKFQPLERVLVPSLKDK